MIVDFNVAKKDGSQTTYSSSVNELVVLYLVAKKGTDFDGNRIVSFEVDGITYPRKTILEFDEKQIRKTNSLIDQLTCGDCRHYTGEECDCGDNEGNEAYDNDQACDSFEF